MIETRGYERKFFIENGYLVVKELKYIGYFNEDGTIRLKSLVGRYYSIKQPAPLLETYSIFKNEVA